jgi:hypothetical protein
LDFQLFSRIVWRHKLVVAIGLVLSIAAGYFTAKRAKPVWQAQTTIFVTQSGFPWGRAIVNVPIPQTRATTSPVYGPPTADANRFISLAILYSHLANGDPVRRIMLQQGKIDGKYEAAPVPSDDGNGYIPFINVTALAGTQRGTEALSLRAANAFRIYLQRTQRANGIPPQNRVELPIVKWPTKAKVVAGNSLTRPIFVFLLAAMATFGCALAVERIRPRATSPPADDLVAAPVLDARS